MLAFRNILCVAYLQAHKILSFIFNLMTSILKRMLPAARCLPTAHCSLLAAVHGRALLSMPTRIWFVLVLCVISIGNGLWQLQSIFAFTTTKQLQQQISHGKGAGGSAIISVARTAACTVYPSPIYPSSHTAFTWSKGHHSESGLVGRLAGNAVQCAWHVDKTFHFIPFYLQNSRSFVCPAQDEQSRVYMGIFLP